MKIWKTLRGDIQKLQSEAATHEELYLTLIEWLERNKSRFPSKLISDYGIDFFVNVKPSDYAVEYSTDSVEDAVSRLMRFEAKTAENILMIIRDVLWDMTAFKSEVECKNCQEDDLRVLFERRTRSLVLSCDLCAWGEYENGKTWDFENNKENLTPALKKYLKGKYIKKENGLYLFPKIVEKNNEI